MDTEWSRYGGYVDVQCDPGHSCPANSLPIAIWSKKQIGFFVHGFSINYTIPYAVGIRSWRLRF